MIKSPGFHQKLTQFKILFININQSSNRYEDVLPVILAIEDWILKNETRVKLIVEIKNYLVYPKDLIWAIVFSTLQTVPGTLQTSHDSSKYSNLQLIKKRYLISISHALIAKENDKLT